ncbi:MAG TPA: hypothetical protein PLU67_02600 [Candidatus Kapabacteria bacterium]|nr:hypothetical protein [Candidatus Kapabacteria bacterium]HOM04364.1 hypothetical protein [Candidatus Kapabacteria bacterium]HPP38671.1 hypothetical protein [Candidatus Kapabacteria bacterium]
MGFGRTDNGYGSGDSVCDEEDLRCGAADALDGVYDGGADENERN